jgi:hypothetical protein
MIRRENSRFLFLPAPILENVAIPHVAMPEATTAKHSRRYFMKERLVIGWILSYCLHVPRRCPDHYPHLGSLDTVFMP